MVPFKVTMKKERGSEASQLAIRGQEHPLCLGNAGRCHRHAPDQLRRAHGVRGAGGIHGRPRRRVWLEPQRGGSGLIAAMDLLGSLWATGRLAGRSLWSPAHNGGGRAAIPGNFAAHWAGHRSMAIHPVLRHLHERCPGHFPGPAGDRLSPCGSPSIWVSPWGYYSPPRASPTSCLRRSWSCC